MKDPMNPMHIPVKKTRGRPKLVTSKVSVTGKGEDMTPVGTHLSPARTQKDDQEDRKLSKIPKIKYDHSF